MSICIPKNVVEIESMIFKKPNCFSSENKCMRILLNKNYHKLTTIFLESVQTNKE